MKKPTRWIALLKVFVVVFCFFWFVFFLIYYFFFLLYRSTLVNRKRISSSDIPPWRSPRKSPPKKDNDYKSYITLPQGIYWWNVPGQTRERPRIILGSLVYWNTFRILVEHPRTIRGQSMVILVYWDTLPQGVYWWTVPGQSMVTLVYWDLCHRGYTGGASQDNPGTVHDWDQQGVYWWSVPGMYSGVLGYFATGGILVDPERPILVKHPRTVHGYSSVL